MGPGTTPGPLLIDDGTALGRRGVHIAPTRQSGVHHKSLTPLPLPVVVFIFANSEIDESHLAREFTPFTLRVAPIFGPVLYPRGIHLVAESSVEYPSLCGSRPMLFRTVPLSLPVVSVRAQVMALRTSGRDPARDQWHQASVWCCTLSGQVKTPRSSDQIGLRSGAFRSLLGWAPSNGADDPIPRRVSSQHPSCWAPSGIG